jgi:NAD(P)-dependent dehydrogenase (short-subunit alcohol dehydrogenase family)
MRNVLVTGGSRGIGLAISRRIAAAGYNVIAVARRESDELRAAVREAGAGAGGLHFRAFDLSVVDAIPAFVKGLRDEFGVIYGLVNNAGIGTETSRHHAQHGDRGVDASQHPLSDRSHKICCAADDGRWRRPHHQHVVHHRNDWL